MKSLHVTQNSAFKNHPRDILRNENHLHGTVLVHIIYKTALNITKHLQVAGYRILKNHQNLNFSLTASLTDHSHMARSQTKQRMAAILRHNNKLTSGMCLPTSVDPLHLVFSFIFNQAACLLHPTKPYRGVNFLYQHILSATYYIDATELFQSWISEALQSWHY